MTAGRYLSLSPPRIWVGDLLSLSQAIPLIPFERRLNVARLTSVRREAGVGWCALFLKAWGRVAQRRAELRRCYLSLPGARLYEHGVSSAMIAVERAWNGERGVFFGQLLEPEGLRLVEIESTLRRLKTAPLNEIREYRRLVRSARLPRPLRWLAWRVAHRFLGPLRVKYFGTFGISVTAAEGASALALLSPTTTTLHYGPLAANGELEVRVTFDHRVLDGAPIARALVDLEETLNGELLDELMHARNDPMVASACGTPSDGPASR